MKNQANNSEHDIPFGNDEAAFDAATQNEAAVGTIVRVADKPKDLTKGQRPHVVIVWNSDVHSVEFVLLVLMKVCKMTKEAAVQATITIHKEGCAPVWRGLLEECELKQEQLRTFRDPFVIEAGCPSVPLEVTVNEE